METEQITENEESENQDITQEAFADEKTNPLSFKLFGLYDVTNIKVNDPGMKRYINVEPKLLIKGYGRVREKFGKSKINILEVFANLIAVPGHRGKKHKIQTFWKSGKYTQNMRIVLDCLKIIEQRTKQNPIQVLVSAIENAAPRDGITVIEYGGARYPQSVDISPERRVLLTMKLIVQGSYDKSFGKKKSIAEALAEELIKCYNNEADSFAITRKRDSEKQADSAR